MQRTRTSSYAAYYMLVVSVLFAMISGCYSKVIVAEPAPEQQVAVSCGCDDCKCIDCKCPDCECKECGCKCCTEACEV